MDRYEVLAAAVRQYLADCAAAGIASRYHPTAAGAVKVIFHRGKAEADAIRAMFASAARTAAGPEADALAQLRRAGLGPSQVAGGGEVTRTPDAA